MAITQEKLRKGLEKLKWAKEEWRLTDDGDSFITGLSLLQPVIYEGRPSMLKIPLTADEQRGFRVMVCWDGNGAAKVYQYNSDALLMERAAGKDTLKQMVLTGKEDEANAIICSVVERLHSSTCLNIPELVPLPVWFKSLGEAAKRYGGLFTTCHETAVELLNDQLDPVVLHGDIHYDNILDSGTRGWIAIDPKGLIGERGFDFANIFCNPDITIAGSPERLSKQVRLIAEAAHVDVKRLLRWVISWSGLSASWMLEDGENMKLPILVGELAIKELNKY